MFVSGESVNAEMLVDDLNDLVQIHYDVMAGYDTAIPRLKHAAYQKVLGDFKESHKQNVLTIALLIEEYGGSLREQSHAAEKLTKARVALGKLLNDEGVIQAMHISEQKLDLEYARDLSSLTAIPGLEPVLRANRTDGAKRLGWFEGEIHMLGHTSRL